MEPRWQVQRAYSYLGTPRDRCAQWDALPSATQSPDRRVLEGVIEERYGSALETTERNRSQQALPVPEGDVVDLQQVRDGGAVGCCFPCKGAPRRVRGASSLQSWN